MYTRALRVYRHTDPDWKFIGERLNRDSRKCKFLSSYMTRSWLRYKNLAATPKLAATVDAGLTADQILYGEFEGVVDKETCEWLGKLVAAPQEPALVNPLVVEPKRRKIHARYRAWTKEDVAQLMDYYPLLRAVRKADMKRPMRETGRSMGAISAKKSLIMKKLDKSVVRPLTEPELDVIRAVVACKSADEVIWKDVRDQLPGRSFEQVIWLLERHRVDLYQYEKCRRNSTL
ncbi:hypothetical protein GGI20_001001 [Coemansia sp. BCRC 34301]|nr:hypothetical protein GGI20_001001 [Coemansia sp. BCRC 34301]